MNEYNSKWKSLSEAHEIVASHVGEGKAEEQLRLAFRDGEVGTRGSGPRGFIPRIEPMQWRLCTGIVPDEERAVFYRTYYPSEAGINLDSLRPITLERIEVDSEQLAKIWADKPAAASVVAEASQEVKPRYRQSDLVSYVKEYAAECSTAGKQATKNGLFKKAKSEDKPFTRKKLFAELAKHAPALLPGRIRSKINLQK